MPPLRRSHEFQNLPSDRKPTHRSPAQTLIQQLAEQASWEGLNGFGSLSDRSRHAYRNLRSILAKGEDTALCYETKPGAFIENQSPEVREALLQLNSEEVESLGDLDPMVLMNWEEGPSPGKRWRFGPFEKTGDHGVPPVENPKVFKISR